MALLNLKHLKNKYALDISKIAHIGAHKGQEVKDYVENFPNAEIILFEPQKNLYQYLLDTFGNKNNISIYNFGLGSSHEFSSMYISNNEGQSSSFFKPKVHLIEHPEVEFRKGEEIFEVKVLDELKIKKIDFLNIDTQGYEMNVLQGSVSLLERDVKYIILEINKKELYEGCPLVKDIDSFLKIYNFVRTDTHFWMDSHSWGDAFYIKKELISNNRYVFSLIKNKLYGFEPLFRILILIRNLIWKIRRKTS